MRSFETLIAEGKAAKIKRLEEDALKLLRNGQFERAQVKALEARALSK